MRRRALRGSIAAVAVAVAGCSTSIAVTKPNSEPALDRWFETTRALEPTHLR